MACRVGHPLETLRNHSISLDVHRTLDTYLLGHPPVEYSEQQLAYDHPVDPICFFLHVQHFVCQSHSAFDNRLDCLLQHRTEDDLEPTHQPVNRKLGRVNKTL